MAERREQLSPANALLNVVALAFLCGTLVTIWLVFKHDAWRYYSMPLATRGYTPAHRFLRPSGPGGHTLGVIGTLFLFMTLLYVARKRLKPLRKAGSVMGWLEFHIFCGVFGPILITFHSSLKFNGVISVAYWSMVLVVLSGFIGRHLYVRIPKTIRGEELSQAEVEARAADLKARLSAAGLPQRLLTEIEDAENALIASVQKQPWLQKLRAKRDARRKSAHLRRDIRHALLNRSLLHETLELAHERALLLRRIARLKKTRELFQLWHVFHRPLVWVMFAIFFVHLGVAIYFGYVPFLEK